MPFLQSRALNYLGKPLRPRSKAPSQDNLTVSRRIYRLPHLVQEIPYCQNTSGPHNSNFMGPQGAASSPSPVHESIYRIIEGALTVKSIRVLIVEDFHAFRCLIASTLAKAPLVQIVGEASDGPEAVQKALELKPDLILMDIGLPTMNGIEAAHQIRKLMPASAIIFLSQESSADVIEAALNTGARAYVVKSKAGAQLLPAIDKIRWEAVHISNQ
jgi:CheY-like chemotaxis protein